MSETSLVHEMHIRSSKSVIMCFQHMQETLQNNPSYENLSGAQHGSRTIFSVLNVLIVAVAFDWAAFSRIALVQSAYDGSNTITPMMD